MTPKEMSDDSKVKQYTDDQIKTMWPQARGELGGFVKALSKNAGITAAQLRMAIQLADEAFDARNKN